MPQFFHKKSSNWAHFRAKQYKTQSPGSSIILYRLYFYFHLLLSVRLLRSLFSSRGWSKYLCKLQATHYLQEKFQIYLQYLTKYLRLILVFLWNSTQQDKFNFYFFKSFLLVLAKFSFWQKDWALVNHSMEFRQFPDVS